MLSFLSFSPGKKGEAKEYLDLRQETVAENIENGCKNMFQVHLTTFSHLERTEFSWIWC